jgi:hypothetical protein
MRRINSEAAGLAGVNPARNAAIDFMFGGIFFGTTPEILATAAPRRVITTSRPASTSASRRLKFAFALTTETRVTIYSHVVIYMTILPASNVYCPTVKACNHSIAPRPKSPHDPRSLIGASTLYDRLGK